MSHSVLIDGSPLDLGALRLVLEHPVKVSLSDAIRTNLKRGSDAVAKVISEGKVVYGINTGFGLLANTRIAAEDLATLQRNLVLSHACGVGNDLPQPIVRLLMVLKVISLTRGASGVRPEAVDALVALINHQILPVIPAKGSVGASGDLAPLAHMTAALMGEGFVDTPKGRQTALDALKDAGLAPLGLAPKEGLAFLNGTQFSTATALAGLVATIDIFEAGLLAGALSTDALKGSDGPFDPRIHELRGQPGQIDVAAALRNALKGSRIRESHYACARVQDPYSFRCQPQVMGAILDVIRNSARTLVIEANAATDNPLVFPDTDEVISGGNFHAEPVGFAADQLALCLAEIGNLSERRLAVLVDPKMSGLPAFLVKDSGLNSGFMIAQVTTAALASENKQLSHPAVVDTVPTSAGQEDHVSMAAHGARRLLDMAFNAAAIVGIELLGAAQGVDFHRPLQSSDVLETVHTKVRAIAGTYDQDRYFAPDLKAATDLVQSGALRGLIGPEVRLIP